MVEETAQEYSNYLRQIDVAKEIDPICTNIDEILTRMDEFENSLILIKNISAATSLSNIADCKKNFQQYADKIDKLQLMLDRIDADLVAIEQNVAKAEEDLGYNSSGIKGFLKPLLEKVTKYYDRSQSADSDEIPTLPTYQPIEVFKANDYFEE